MLFLLILLSVCRVSASEYKYELLNENDGFATSIIFSVVQDDNGFLWFGTGYNGIMRYDGKNVVKYSHDPEDPRSLPNDNAGNLILDHSGNLWIGSWGGSVIKFDLRSQVFSQFKHDKNKLDSISDFKVQSIFEDSDETLWFGTYSNGLNRFDRETQSFQHFLVESDHKTSISDQRVWDIEQSEADEIWLATGFGLNKLDKRTGEFTHYFPEPKALLLDINKIRSIEVNQDGDLFLGTQNGLVFFNTETETFTKIESDNMPNLGPIYSMISTDFGEYWASTDYGVFSFTDNDKTLKKVPFVFDDSCSQTLFQDRQSTIWLSCEGVGVYKITRTNIFQSFDEPRVKTAFALQIANDDSVLIGTSQIGLQKWIPESKKLTSLVNSEMSSAINYIVQTSNDDIWYASTQSLYLLDSNGQQIEVTPPREWWDEFESIRDIERDAFDNIWVAAPKRLFIVNSKDQTFESVSLQQAGASQNSSVELYLDPYENMWVAINDHLYKWDPENKALNLFSWPEDKTDFRENYNYVYTIFVDSKRQLWLSTKTGLYLVNQASGEREIVSQDFLERDNRGIRFISEDDEGVLWLVTPIGVSSFNPSNNDVQHFDKRDGLPGSRYFYNPTIRKSDGTIFLSSRDGISYFTPSTLKNRTLDEGTVLTNFEVLDSSEKYNLAKIEEEGINLHYSQSNIKFEFATLDLLNARQIQYSYFLDGFDNAWVENGNNSSATYTNLSGGDYVFRVRSKVKDTQWYEEELAVNLTIGIPFWQRWWMFVVYIVLVLLGFLYYVQQQKRAVINLERQVAEKTADIAEESEKLAVANRIKTQFLANMSHEIRTPLTTVIGQAEAIICRDVKQEDIYKEVEIIHDSSLYLLALLNDILDLTKIEENKFELEYAPQNLQTLLNNINTMFSMQARVKGLSFSLEQNLPNPFVIDIDGLRLKQILINLLSNALKFTLRGHVTLEVLMQDETLIFNVKDTGIGVSQDQLEQIFGSFTQGDSSIRRRFGGSGLGLHLSNQLALLMNGEITVKSVVDEGSVFTFSMPMPKMSSGTEMPAVNLDLSNLSSKPLFQGKILLAEDHADNRRLISRLLTKLGLTVYTAADGYEAISLYQEHEPEVVLMDIQMPNMDGIEAYKKLRELGSEKPIIALTANAMTNEVDHYFSLGFDGYIQKPIDRKLLISTIATFFNGHDDDAMRRANSMLGNVDMSDLVDEFKASLNKEIAAFKSEIEKQNVPALKALAHRLSGASQLFGFSELSSKATELETQIKNENPSYSEIEKHVEELFCEIKRIIG